MSSNFVRPFEHLDVFANRRIPGGGAVFLILIEFVTLQKYNRKLLLFFHTHTHIRVYIRKKNGF